MIRSLSRALLALLLAAPLTTRASTVWVASSTEKIRGDAPAGAAGVLPVRLTAARNEFEAFQIAVTGAASGVRATATVLRGPGGASIPAPRLFREAIYQVSTKSSPDSPGVGPYPDAMVPDIDDVVGEKRNAFPFDVLAGQTRVIWVEALVPAAAPAGDYTGTVIVDGAGLLEVVDVTLHVWNFALPTTSSLRSHYGLSWPELPKGHGFPAWSAPGTDDDVLFTDLRARYAQIGLDHRISIGGFNDNHFDDIGHFEKHFGPFMDGTAPTQLPGARLTTTQWIAGASDSLQRQQVKAAAWISRFKSHASPDGKSWFDRLFDYTCDEPGNICSWSTIAGRAAMVKAADPSFRTLVTTTIDGASEHQVAGQIDLMVVVINWLDGKPGAYAGNQRPRYDDFLAPGGARDPLKEVWTYQGCSSHGTCGNYESFEPSATGWPSLVIDAESMRARSLEWQSFIHGVSGELYYATTLAYQETRDPWSDQYLYGGHGDGTLFYPGTPARIGGGTHIPVASLRLKMIREGSEDFEYLKLLSDAGEAQLADSIARTLFPNAWSVPTASALLAAREQIAARIEAKLGATASPLAAGDAGPPAGPAGPTGGAGSQPAPGTGTGAGLAGVPGAPGATAIGGSGCSAGATADILAGIGLAAAMLLRRRRSR